ncbi:MAG: Glutamine--fructose-6-phosphate aminotransferase [isomerizing] [uncultured Acidimicrobiales bacterium]|uniref:Glutamine--fructose-6-phosphate aminotransferase [isomerizing] n=1 Tax=uncultured Acidimicrobiales bacterium TaxID=310071 RepID=A0A6J4I3Y9_9ACTN|nr:MAG: Glutamine--fructose-6-phosphate aminotransferase [isomerizing] [uncultured Acidimicrobiales bacterium]
MCGIVGVTGSDPALPFLLDGLSRLEYRGYDSSGVALVDSDRVWVRRRAGKLAELTGAVGDAPRATAGIGHTRWATHGGPTEHNAHPHTDCTGALALVHNGIIENHLELGDELVSAGHELRSETDSEVLAHLIEAGMAGGAGLADATRAALARVEGSFAVAVVHAANPEVIVAGRRSSPLVAGRADGSGFVASDIPALLAATREVYVLDDDQIVEVGPGTLRVTTLDGTEVSPVRRRVEGDVETAEKGGYPDFMLKEIHEQPRAVRETLRGRTKGDRLTLGELELSDQELRDVDKVFIVGCGTSFHAGMVARHAIEHWARLPTEIEVASEFRYRDPVLDAQSLVVGVSQSGESLDTMEACRFARSATNKAKVLVVCNVVDSSMAREADAVLYTRAGPERGVAATKTHVAQIVAMELLALRLAHVRGLLYPEEVARQVEALHSLPTLIDGVLARSEEICDAATSYVDTRDFFFLGRGVGYPVALEGALKLKEISYARAEAYPAGEMKHGPIALIEPGTVVVAVATRGRLHAKIMNNIDEVKARGATVVVVANEGDDAAANHADRVLWVPAVPRGAELFSPLVDVVALQLFAYAIAKARGCDVDQPRNLAKTVTVE